MVLLAARELGPYLIWLGVMMAAVTVAGVALLIFRASVLGKGKAAAEAGILDSLRSMRERGEISQEEFDAARSAMVTRMAGRAAASPAVPPSPRAKASGGERVAPPGFDLTGRPLPPAPDEGPDR
jgi:hypothetical protein